MIDALTIVTTVISCGFLISEYLPYATSSRCNSIIEALSHLFCKNNCFMSNKQIVFDNHEMLHTIQHLQQEIKDLKEVRLSLDLPPHVRNSLEKISELEMQINRL
jgi:hypothetical protein